MTNTNAHPIAVNLFFDDPMPLLPHWQSPRATLRRSRCQSVQPDIPDMIRPSFYNFRSRCDALLRTAGYVPPRVVRRHADPIAWPLVSVSRNTQLTRMVFNHSVGVSQPAAADDRSPGQDVELAPAVPLQGAHDGLLSLCLEALRQSTPDTVEDRIDAALAVTQV